MVLEVMLNRISRLLRVINGKKKGNALSSLAEQETEETSTTHFTIFFFSSKMHFC